MTDPKTRIAELLQGASDSSDDPDAARRRAEELYALVYPQLRELAGKIFRDERAGHTLQPTALVHEAYLRCLPERGPEESGHGRTGAARAHFFAAGARAMRRVLIDHARGRGRDKRGGGWQRVTLTEQLALGGGEGVDALDLHEALLELGELDPVQAELVELRFYGGLSLPQAARLQGLAQRTAEREWTLAKAWLRRRLSEGRGG